MISPALILALLAPVAVSVPADPPAPPAPTRGSVIVLRPAEVDEVTRTALARVTGELTAARFQVTEVPLDPKVDPTPQVENVALESHAVAAFAIAHISEAGGDTIAIWVSDRLGRRTTIQRMALRGSNVSQDAEVLALEAIELIRVSIAGLWPAPQWAGQAEAASVTPAAEESPPPRWKGRPDIALGLGVAMLKDVAVPSSQWMGSLTGTLLWPRGLALRLQVNGLGPGQTVTGNAGTAAVHRQLAALGIGWVFWRPERVQSMVTLAVGVERLAASGSAPDPARARTVTAWSALAALGLGAAVRLGGGLSLTAEVNGILTVPPLVLRVADRDTNPFSRPGILVNVGLQATF